MQERLPDGPLLYREPLCSGEPNKVSFSLGYFSLTPGILPYALRASFAVRARSCVHVDKQKRSNSGAAGARKLFAVNSDAAASMELKVLAPVLRWGDG